MKKLLTLLVILAVCGYIFNVYSNKETIDNSANEQYNSEIRKLEIKKQELVNKLDEKQDLSVKNMGSIIFLFSDIDKKHLEEAIVYLNENNYRGVLAMSTDDIPKTYDNKNMTKKEVKQLIDNNYEIVVKLLENESALDAYEKIKKKGYDVKGFYIPYSRISIETINEIKSIGNMVIIGNFGSFEDDELFLIEKYGNHNPDVKNKFLDSLDESKTIAISVGHSDSKDESYNNENYSAMLNVIKPYIEKQETVVCNISEANLRYEDYKKVIEDMEENDQKQKEIIKQQIEDIDMQITRLEQ